MSGTVRRNRFTQWELDLLLELQLTKLRKSARVDVLRRYLRAVQQCHALGVAEPPKFSVFLAQTPQRKAAAHVASG